MRRYVQLTFLPAGLLLILFALGISSPGQLWLRGDVPQDHWKADDAYIGAGLAPYVFCFVPAIGLVCVGAVVSLRNRAGGFSRGCTVPDQGTTIGERH